MLAGAGSGKTRVITHKIARLIQMDMKPERIAAITFTNKAAAEMRERARALIGKPAQKVVICTFHALGVRMLRQHGTELGLKPRFSILDSDDVLGILKDAGGSTDTATARQWQWTISAWKSAGLNSAEALAQAQTDDEYLAAAVMAKYEERLTAYQSVDFDDLITLPLKLLQNNEHVVQHWRGLMGHILIDEYQDTNATQYAILKCLVGDKPRFTAVGDDDQSIYGWRGATLENLKKLPIDFPSLKVIKLEQNYRSTSAILRAANHVIQPNPKLFPKNLWSDLGEGEPVRVVDADHEEHEAERAVARILGLRAQGGQDVDWQDFAILYRANHQAKPFEKALRRANIPYKVSGGTSFFDRAEIRDLCAWLRLWANNDDNPAFIRAITTPKRGIGHQTLATLGDFADRSKQSLFDSLFSFSLAAVLNQKALESLHEFARYVSDLQDRAQHITDSKDAAAFLSEWLMDIGYESYLLDTEDSATLAASKWENVREFCDWIAKRCTDKNQTLLEATQTVALISTLSEREKEQNVVTLSTLHAAKGLEWTHVMLVGVTEGMLPFKLDENPEADATTIADNAIRLQEERRLMYVGITRAQRTLAVSWTRRRKKGREMVIAKPSRFIEEMNLDKATSKEDPREKLRALRAEFAARAGNINPTSIH
ncbi:MAG: hypothetical protein RIR79_2091 [Pseudomonadota bacterium]